MTTMKMISVIGSLLLAFCSVPELIRTLKNKKCGIGWGMIIMWYLGELCVLSYVLYRQEYILSFNYALNIAIVSIMVYFKVEYD